MVLKSDCMLSSSAELSFSLIFIYFIYLAALGLSCDTRDLQSLL